MSEVHNNITRPTESKNNVARTAELKKKAYAIIFAQSVIESAIDSINGTAEQAYNDMQAKQAEYDAAMAKLSKLEMPKYFASREFASVKNNHNNNSSIFHSTKSKYESLSSLYSGAETNADILRSSLQSRISFCGKMNQSASLANAALA